MFPYVVAGVVGAILMGRTKPKTSFAKLKLLGPHSGLQYEAEDFPDFRVVVLHAPDGSVCSFQKGADGRWSVLKGRGNEQTLQRMIADLGASQ